MSFCQQGPCKKCFPEDSAAIPRISAQIKGGEKRRPNVSNKKRMRCPGKIANVQLPNQFLKHGVRRDPFQKPEKKEEKMEKQPTQKIPFTTCFSSRTPLCSMFLDPFKAQPSWVPDFPLFTLAQAAFRLSSPVWSKGWLHLFPLSPNIARNLALDHVD